jgi:hypothetical protein
MTFGDPVEIARNTQLHPNGAVVITIETAVSVDPVNGPQGVILATAIYPGPGNAQPLGGLAAFPGAAVSAQPSPIANPVAAAGNSVLMAVPA